MDQMKQPPIYSLSLRAEPIKKMLRKKNIANKEEEQHQERR
jgi:hypothetical protein